MAFIRSFSALGSNPNLVRSSVRLPLSRIRSTIFSPNSTGRVETRKSITRLPIFSFKRPSCGTRRSAMLSCDRIFTRRESRLHFQRRTHDLEQCAVDSVAHPDFVLERFDVNVAGAAPNGVGQETVDQL